MGLNVVLIDDDPDEHVFIAEAFAALTSEVFLQAFGSGESAINQIYADPKTGSADFILLDINMPKMDGFTVLRLLKASEKTTHIPVYMLSTSNHPNDERRAKALGAAGFYCKPNVIDGYNRVMCSILTVYGSVNHAAIHH